MPVLKHAKKKLRQDIKRTADNLRIKETYKKLLKAAKAKPSTESISKAFQAIDKAAKNNIIHDNKAARLKSALARTVSANPRATDTSKQKTAKAKSSKAKSVKKAAQASKAANADKKTPTKKN
jgi:small subunit ribosomal protein S20